MGCGCCTKEARVAELAVAPIEHHFSSSSSKSTNGHSHKKPFLSFRSSHSLSSLASNAASTLGFSPPSPAEILFQQIRGVRDLFRHEHEICVLGSTIPKINDDVVAFTSGTPDVHPSMKSVDHNVNMVNVTSSVNSLSSYRGQNLLSNSQANNPSRPSTRSQNSLTSGVLSQKSDTTASPTSCIGEVEEEFSEKRHEISGGTKSAFNSEGKTTNPSTGVWMSETTLSKTSGGTKGASMAEDSANHVVAHHEEDIDDPEELLEMLARSGIAFTSRKARKLKLPNQDNYAVCRAVGFTIMVIVDGHGDNGHWASHWAARYVTALFLTEVCKGHSPSEQQMKRIFNLTHEALILRSHTDGFDVSYSGCTLSLCIVDKEALVFAWIGDSKCVVGRVAKPHEPSEQSGHIEHSSERETQDRILPTQVLWTSTDHKPNDIAERQRVMAAGGVVRQDSAGISRVGPGGAEKQAAGEEVVGLAVSRAIGDTALHRFGINHLPGVHKVPLKDLSSSSFEAFIVMCSDGVWDMLSPEHVVAKIGQAGSAGTAEAVQALVTEARRCWIEAVDEFADTDDITIIVVWI